MSVQGRAPFAGPSARAGIERRTDALADRVVAGGGLGAMLAMSGLGGIGVLIGLGFYMPFNIVLTYTIGNLIRIAVDTRKGIAFVDNVGIPVAAGMAQSPLANHATQLHYYSR